MKRLSDYDIVKGYGIEIRLFDTISKLMEMDVRVNLFNDIRMPVTGKLNINTQTSIRPLLILDSPFS